MRYWSPNFCPSVRPSTFTSKFDIYVEVFVFSALVIAETVKPCIVIVLDIPSSTHLDPVPLTYISRYIDSLIFTSNFFFISDSCECETLRSKCPSHTLSEYTLTWCPRPIFHVFSYFARCRCDIDLHRVLVCI